MNISIGSNSLYSQSINVVSDKIKTGQLQDKLQANNGTDDELMEACKSFESYLLTQVMKSMEKTIPGREDKGPYLEQFGDFLYDEYAKAATESQSLGIAQMLYESIKRNA
ncbi:MAG TPA: hypothetical protein GXZ21_03100 [Clostridiales bacterium]|nr:hypothetical protein [Clostridiales bacterium]